MHLTELDFDFPEELIAQKPVEPRDSCRLMYLPAEGLLQHGHFFDLPGLLRRGDTVVFNDSRVLPARVEAQKPTGGRVELLFLRPVPAAGPGAGGRSVESWEVLARPSHRLREGGRLLLTGGEEVVLRSLLGDGRWVVQGTSFAPMVDLMEKYGRLPLPPYIKDYSGDPGAYQTVYALPPGSAAAPTAGLHFTPEVMNTLESQGIGSVYVTLHVGLDTFQPIREENVEQHRIHRETYTVSREALAALRAARVGAGRLVAVGTTAARVLETLAASGVLDHAPQPGSAGSEETVSGSTEIFITPGHRFQAVDVLLTNFHLPRSTVLALVMAFAGQDRIRDAYRQAIELRYRFFSFGDAMLIERDGAERHGGAQPTLKGADS